MQLWFGGCTLDDVRSLRSEYSQDAGVLYAYSVDWTGRETGLDHLWDITADMDVDSLPHTDQYYCQHCKSSFDFWADVVHHLPQAHNRDGIGF